MVSHSRLHPLSKILDKSFSCFFFLLLVFLFVVVVLFFVCFFVFVLFCFDFVLFFCCCFFSSLQALLVKILPNLMQLPSLSTLRLLSAILH